jgi:hypothetical protein
VLDKQGRTDRARKAAQVSVENRRAAVVARNHGIRLAYARLTGQSLSKADEVEAIRWLQEQKCGVNMPTDKTSVYRHLAKVTDLSKQAIYAIVNKKVSSVDAPNG